MIQINQNQKIKFLKTDYSTKITEIEGKIPHVTNLATKTALITVKNKIPDVSSLVKKQIMTLKLQKLKINLIIIIMKNILILKSLINQLVIFLMRDQPKQTQ